MQNIVYENGEARVISIPGHNAGVQLSLALEKDPLSDCSFYLGKSYYFGVCAYVVNKDLTPQFFTSDTSFLTIVPQHQPLDLEPVQEVGDTLLLTYNGNGFPDSSPVVQVIEPSLLTGHRYRIGFQELDNHLTWFLVDITANDTLLHYVPLRNPVIASYVSEDEFNPIIEGIFIKFPDNLQGMRDIVELTPDGRIGDYNLWHSTNQYGQNQDWPIFLVSSDSNSSDKMVLDRYREMGDYWYEFRFVADSSLAWDYRSGKLLTTRVPYQIIQIDPSTSRETRLCPLIIDQNEDKKWSRTNLDLFTVAPAFEPVYCYKDIAYRVEEEGIYRQVNDGTIAPGFDLTQEPSVTGLCFVMWIKSPNYISPFPVDSTNYFLGPPALGERILIRNYKPLRDNDVFEFETTAPIHYSQLERSHLKEITIFPNPYPGSNRWVTDPYNRYVTFGNLPGKCKIQIFSLSGDLVALLEHDDGTPFQRWDLRNNRGDQRQPVASGIYIARVEVPGVGERILKLGILQTEPVIVK